MTKIAILGAGISGLGAAYRFRQEGVEAVVYERESRPGGHTRSFRSADGFVFDDGPHISFTRDSRIQEIFAASVDQEYEILQARVNNYWRGRWVKHPAQCNLAALPADLTATILREFAAVERQESAPPRNYEEWLIAAYGPTFARTFPMEYGLKYHTTEARSMSTDWLGPRLYRPELEEVVRGAIAEETADVHYVDHFRYPTEGGFESFLRLLVAKAEIRTDQEVVRIDPQRREIGFADGRVAEVDALVSSLPLTALVPLIVGAPREVRQAATRLACTQCVTVNLGIAREGLSDHHWTYLYDRELIATRLSFPHLFSTRTVPTGSSSVQAELYYSAKYRPLRQSPESLIDPVVSELTAIGVLRESDRIVHRSARLVEFANVIFDRDRQAAVTLVGDYLETVGICTCGRYGEWGYHWTDESFLSGEAAAQQVLDGARLVG